MPVAGRAEAFLQRMNVMAPSFFYCSSSGFHAVSVQAVQAVGECALHASANLESISVSAVSLCLLCRRSMIEGSTRISSGMAIKQLASRGSKGAGGASNTLVCGITAECVHAPRSTCVQRLDHSFSCVSYELKYHTLHCPATASLCPGITVGLAAL